MSKKMMFHCGVLVALVIYTMVAWNSVQSAEEQAKEAAKESLEDGQSSPWDDVEKVKSSNDEAAGMVKVGIPILVTVIYAGILTVIYLLPAMVDKVSEEMMGSSAEVDDDPLVDARAAVSAEEYPEAIAIYRKLWLENPEDRRPLLEIAKIQRVHLESPAVAVSTLEEGLEEVEWPPDEAAFILFRIAEIYEEDLEDQDKVIETMKRVMKDLEGTRHAGNAAHKLRLLGAS